MTVAFIQNRANDAAPASSIARAFASNVSAGSLLLVYCWQGNDSTDDTASWTVSDTLGNTYTRFAHSAETTFNASGATGSKQAIFATITTNGGANTITVSFGASKLYTRMIIWEWSGTTSPVASAVPSSAADTAAHPFQEVPYYYRTSTVEGDPGSGNLRLNNATLSSVTAAYFDQIDALSNDRTTFFTRDVAPGSTMRFYLNGDNTKYVLYTVNSVTNNSGWFTVALTYQSTSGSGAPTQTDNTAWWARMDNILVMPGVTSVANGRVAAAVQDLNGGGTGFTAGSGYGNLINTASDGRCGSEDKATSEAATVYPVFGSDNSIANGFGISWVLAPAGAEKQTSYYRSGRSWR